MSIFIQEVLGLLKRNQKKITLDKTKDWFEFGKLYQSSVLNTGASYNPKMDPFVIKWGDLVCQATEDLTRTLPGEGKLGYVPVYTDPSGTCSWDTLKDSIITQNTLNTIITIGGNLVVTGDVAINGCDLTSTCTTFNLLNTGPVSFINFGGSSSLIEMSNAGGIVNVNGTAQSTSCTTGALVVKGGVGIAKNLYVCNDLNVAGDAAINGGDLTSTVTTFNLLNQSTNINFGNTSQNILIGGLNATSTVQIVGTKESTLCSNGALIVAGGVGIAKNLNVCGNLTITGISNLNGNVNLGDAIGDNIRLYGTLLDNNGNSSLINQALVGTGTGAATWQNVALVGQVCAVNSIPLWTPNASTLGCSLIYQNGNSSTPATKIFIKGGLASEGSQVRTIYDVAIGYGNYAGGESSAAFGYRSLALGGDSFACGHKGFAGGHGSLAAGYNTGAGNYGFGLFTATVTSATLTINILSGTIAVGNFIVPNVDTDPSIRYEILTLVGTGTIGVNTITIATPISVDINEAVAIEEAVPDRGDSQGAISLGVSAASKGSGAVAIGTRAATDIPNQIAIGSSSTTVKLDGTVQDDTQNKVLVIDSSNVVKWRNASTIGNVTANNGLTINPANNVQLGGTLIQNADINTGDYRIRLTSSTTKTNPVFIIDALGTSSTAHGISVNSANGYAGYFETNIGLGAIYASNNGTTSTTTFLQSNGQVVSKFTRTGSNNTGIDNILDLYNTCSTGPAVVGLGTGINFNIEDNLSVPSNAGSISFDWVSFSSGNSSRFVVKTVGFGTSSNKLEVSNEGQLKLNIYGLGAFYDPGNVVNYTLATKTTGEIVEVPYQAQSKTFAALISQTGLTEPSMQILQDFSGGGAITWTWSYVSPGLYTLQSSQAIFNVNKTAVYIIPDVSAGKPYCAAIERQSDTVLLVNSFDPTTGNSANNLFDKATLKIEIYL
jgi:hypothetical protein